MRHGSRRDTSGTRRWAGLGLTLAVLLLAPAAASANTITVNSTVDPTAAGCTLHDAITAANTNVVVNGCAAGTVAGTDTIDFSLPNPSTITLAGALPDISSDIAITGPGSGQLTVSGQDTVRPFNVLSTHTDSISGLTIAHGLCDDACGSGGGAILNAGTLTLTDVTITSSNTTDDVQPNSFPGGGGIQNLSAGTVHLILSTVSANSSFASGATSQNAPFGGGIANQGVLTLDRSTVSGNDATAIAGAGATTNAIGGGIFNSKQVTVTQSTISGNTVNATAGTGNSAAGGGIFQGNLMNATITLDRATLTGNTASGDGTPEGGAIVAFGGTGSALNVSSSTITGNSAPLDANILLGTATRSFRNTIVSNPLGGGVNCSNTNSGSQGFNIEDTNTCGFTQAGDQHGINPMLGVLTANGGPTQTMALLTGSPAIDQGGLSSLCPTSDQRGFARPSDFTSIANVAGGDGTDIGAFEVQAPGAPTPTCPTPPSSIPPSSTPATTTPDTSLSPRIRKRKRKATFTFGSDKPESSFMCKLDKRAFSPCTSPITFRHLRTGRHTFMVEAVNAAGTDPFPATFSFKLKG